MRRIHLAAILVLLALALPAPAAHAAGVVSVCDEAHLKSALAGGGTVTFSCSGTIILTSTITIAANTTIDGTGQTVMISGNHAVRIFVLNSGISLSLNNLTVAYGNVTGTDQDGGGILSSGGLLTVNNTTFSTNSAEEGGAICSNGGTVTVANSGFFDNSAGNYGGAIAGHGSTVTVTDANFSGNSSGNGAAGIYADGS